MMRKYNIATVTLLFLVGCILIQGNTLLADAQDELRKDRMVLEKKEGECVVANERCYRISEITNIKNSRGATISHSRLPTPCSAKLTYYHNTKENGFELILIEVLDDTSMGGE